MRPVSLFILLSALASCTGTGTGTDSATTDTSTGGTDTPDPTDGQPTDGNTDTDTDTTTTGDTGKKTATGADAILPGELVITEVLHSPLAVDDTVGEWFELHNTTKRTLDLNGLVVFDGVEYFGVYQSLEIEPGAYAIFARNGDQSVNGGIVPDYVFGAAMALDSVDTINLGNGSGSLDTVRWTKYFDSQQGLSISLSSDQLTTEGNDLAENWCLARQAFGRGDFGTPGFPNPNCDPSKKKMSGDTGGDTGIEPAPAESIGVGDLVITEIMQNPVFVDDVVGEWFEVYNATKKDIDIRGMMVGDNASDGFTIPWDPDKKTAPILIPAGGYFVFGANSNTTLNGNVGVDYDYVRSDFFLSNGPDEVVLSNGAGVIDEVAYDGGKLAWPDPAGASMNLTSTVLDATGNDAGGDWCEATSPIDAAQKSSDSGTPGAANDTCAP